MNVAEVIARFEMLRNNSPDASERLAYDHALGILRKVTGPCIHEWKAVTVGMNEIRLRECQACGASEEAGQ